MDIKLIKKQQDNIKYIDRRLTEDDLNTIMNSHGIHICTSSTEGFGHYINEAKSCKSVYIPVNELINSESGILIKPKKIKNKYPSKKT